MFNKIFPEKVDGETVIKQNIDDIERAIGEIGKSHHMTKEGNEIIIIPKGVINVLGLTNPIRNYKKLIFKLIKIDDENTKVEYSIFRKLSKASTIIYIIFILLDLFLIFFLIIYVFPLMLSEPEIAFSILSMVIFWIFITICAFLFDYFLLLSKGAILRGFNNNILNRIKTISGKIRKNRG